MIVTFVLWLNNWLVGCWFVQNIEMWNWNFWRKQALTHLTSGDIVKCKLLCTAIFHGHIGGKISHKSPWFYWFLQPCQALFPNFRKIHNQLLFSETWWQLRSSLEPRSGHVMTLYQNFTTIIGGVNADNESLGSMESFVKGSWVKQNEILTKRKNFRVTQVPNNFFPQNH